MRAHSGFSLVELSIVLVILGLLTGGILSGQALIRAAELRSVTNDTSRYMTAVHTFRDRYLALPGDMPNAGKFWGYANTAGTGGGCANPGTDVGTGTQTCDGTGDGYIYGSSSTRFHEIFRFWQHLANAGLIEGTYSGIQASAANHHAIPGLNIPSGKIGTSGYYMSYASPQTDTSGGWWPGAYGNVLRVGGVISNNWPAAPFLLPEEAWNIDTKLDDGKPQRGRIMTWPPMSLANCNNSNDPSVAGYNLTHRSAACFILVIPGI